MAGQKVIAKGFVRKRSRRISHQNKRVSNMSRILLGNDSWELFEGIPKHYSLRTRVRMKLQFSSIGIAWEFFQTVFAILVSAMYVIQTYEANFDTHRFDTAALVVFTLDYLINFYCCEHRFTGIMDAVTILPALVDSIQSTGGHNRFPFIRFIRVLRLLRLTRLFRTAKIRSISAVQTQICSIILLITSIVFISAGLYYEAEVDSQVVINQPLMTFGDALYFVVVTMATVGYGDIAPTTSVGKSIAVAAIIVAFTVIPTELTRLTQLMRLQSQFRKVHHPSIGNPHILVVGHVTDPRALLDFFRELYHPDRILEDSSTTSLSEPACVLMGPHEPTEAIINLLDHPVLQNRVTYIKGSVMSEDDLCRVGADAARACFVLASKSTANPKQTDGETVLRLLAIRNYNPDLEIYTQIVSPAYTDYINEVDTDHVLCLDQIKLSLMAKSCLWPGLVTLVSNLFRSSAIASHDMYKGWEREYIEGMALEVYATVLPPAFFGFTFSQACEILYRSSNGEVVLLGVLEKQRIATHGPSSPLDTQRSTLPNYTMHQSPQHHHRSASSRMLSNPGNTILMGSGQIVYVLSESKKLTQTASISTQLKEWLSVGNKLPVPDHVSNESVASTETSPSAEKTQNRSNGDIHVQIAKRTQAEVILEDGYCPTTGEEIRNHILVVSNLDEASMQAFIEMLRLECQEQESCNYHPIIFLSWSMKNVLSVCRILQEYDDVYLMLATGDSKAEFMRANILTASRCVLLADKSTVQELDGEIVDSKTIFHYLAILSIQAEFGTNTISKFMPMVELTIPRTMKILDTALKKRTANSSHDRHKLDYLMSKGHEDPVRAAEEEIHLAKRHPRVQQRKKTSLLNDVFAHVRGSFNTFEMLIKLRKRISTRRSVIRQQEESNKCTYFDPSGSTRLPFFAAGYGFADDIFDNMLCQSYFTPGLIRFIYALLFSQHGKPSYKFGTLQSSRHKSAYFPMQHESDDQDETTVVSSLVQIKVPKQFVAKTFGDLFIHLIAKENIVAIGLYRGSGVPFSFPYVATGPAIETVLASNDLVFVLAQPDALQRDKERRRQEETENSNASRIHLSRIAGLVSRQHTNPESPTVKLSQREEQVQRTV